MSVDLMKVWISEGRIMVMEEGSAKPKLIYGKLFNNSVVYSVCGCLGFLLILGHLYWDIFGYSRVRTLQSCLFTFWEAVISRNEPLKILSYYYFLIFLITEKIISTSLLCSPIINFVIKLYFKSYIKFKSNYQRSLKLLNSFMMEAIII